MSEPQEPEDRTSEEDRSQPEAAGRSETVELTDTDAEVASTASGAAPGRGPGAVAVLALLLAAAALVLAARPWWPWPDPMQPDESEQQRLARLDALETHLAEVEDQADRAASMARSALERVAARAEAVERAESGMDATRQRIDALRTRIERQDGDLNADLEALRTRIESVEASVSRRLEEFALEQARFSGDIADAEQDLAQRLLLIELERLFATAADLAETLNDRAAARAVWQRALDRMQALDGARFADLRRHAAEALEQLDGGASDATAGVRRLGELAADAARWPIRGQPDAAPATSATVGGSRWARLRGVFDNLVKVEPLAAERLSPAQVEMERARVAALLQTAALALARGDELAAARLAEQAMAVIEQVFEPGDADIVAALDALRRVADQGADELQAPAISATRSEIRRLIGAENS